MPLVSLNGPKTEKRAGACASQLIVCALLYIRGRRKAKLAADNGSRARVSAAAACLFSPFQLEAFERTCVCSEKAQPHGEITGSHISRLVARDFFFLLYVYINAYVQVVFSEKFRARVVYGRLLRRVRRVGGRLLGCRNQAL